MKITYRKFKVKMRAFSMNIYYFSCLIQKKKVSLHSLSGCSVARLSRLLWEQEAAGSNPATPTKKTVLN